LEEASGSIVSWNTGGDFDLAISLVERPDRLMGEIAYARQLFDPEAVERIAAMYVRLVTAAAAAPNTSVADLPLLDEKERLQLTEGFNATRAAYPDEALIHELFEAQARKAPDAVAVVYEDDSLTYGELDARANRLAHHLLGRGVQPDDRVAICLERSLACWRSSRRAAPMCRSIRLILPSGWRTCSRTRPVAVFTHRPARAAPEGVLQAAAPARPPGNRRSVPLIELAADAPLWANQPAAPDTRANGLTSAKLAYVIYT
jgi:non-ribosomal peptide synthetase component F